MSDRQARVVHTRLVRDETPGVCLVASPRTIEKLTRSHFTFQVISLNTLPDQAREETMSMNVPESCVGAVRVGSAAGICRETAR